MYKIDNEFLKLVGLDSMPEDKKPALLDVIYKDLEYRMGERLTDGISNELLDEFGEFVDMNMSAVKAWISENVPDYKKDKLFIDTKLARGSHDDNPSLLCEYGAMKWLQHNRPDYPQVFEDVIGEISSELIQDRKRILSFFDCSDDESTEQKKMMN